MKKKINKINNNKHNKRNVNAMFFIKPSRNGFSFVKSNKQKGSRIGRLISFIIKEVRPDTFDGLLYAYTIRPI